MENTQRPHLFSNLEFFDEKGKQLRDKTAFKTFMQSTEFDDTSKIFMLNTTYFLNLKSLQQHSTDF